MYKTIYSRLTWQEEMKLCLDTFGKLISNTNKKFKIGNILTLSHLGDRLPQPFRIVREASEEEYNKQCELLKIKYDYYYSYFYEIATD